MAIMPIESLPGEQVDQFKAARDALTEDVLQIIRQKIPLCEITSEKYTTNTMRDALKRAVRYAEVLWNRREAVQEGEIERVDGNMFTIIRRKSHDGKYHYYIEFSGAKEDE